ncbi:MAG: acyl-ACP--UDP-N-acetylglucosamine O-acyltransferase [candidate division WOR-3 bacterium]
MPLWQISPRAEIGCRVRISPFCVIEDQVKVGDDCQLGPGVVLYAGTEIGPGCHLGPGVVIGGRPMDTAYQGEPTRVRIGSNNDLREFVTIHRSTGPETATLLGNDNLIMAYVHIAHNCRIGTHTVITNACQLGGYVEVGDRAVIGGMTGIHQHVRIGTLAMVGACSYLSRDLPPYMLGAGVPFRVRGLNDIGLRRNGFSAETRRILRAVHRLVYRSALGLRDALEQVARRYPDSPEVREFVRFCRRTSRGLQLSNPQADELSPPANAAWEEQ